MNYEKLIDAAFEGAVRDMFDVFFSNLLPVDSRPAEQREAAALAKFRDGLAFAKRARELMIQAVKEA